MEWLLAILLISSGHRVSAVTDTVDLIEVNRTGLTEQFAFTQTIFWEYAPEHRRYNVVAWTILPCVVTQTRDGATAKWYDPDLGKTRIVRSKLFRQTDTVVDPERENEKIFPKYLRRGLSKQ